jgi:DNA-binding transcriptional ArsR family regulator
VLRLEAITHNTKSLGVGRVLDKSGDIVIRLGGICDRFDVVCDCVDTSFVPDGLLDDLPRRGQVGAARTGGVSLDSARIRAVLAAVVAPAPVPDGFTVADLTAKVHTLTGQTGYTRRQAAYDLKKLRGKHLIDKPGRTRRYHVSPDAIRAVTALLTLREKVIAPLVAGVHDDLGHTPATSTRIDRGYQALPADMRALFHDLGITTMPAAA